MNKVSTLIFGGAALAAVALVSAPMAAAPDGGRPFAHGAHMRGGFAGGAPLISIALKHKSELNLGTDQVAKLEQIKSNYQTQMTPLHQQIRTIEKEIAGLTQQSPADLVKIKSKIQEGEKYRSELRYLQHEATDNGQAVLSVQQRDQLKSLVASRHENFR
ncbi:MAG: Spy/CpxP family protein refolding chaperone, partial [Candidatus Binatia bacterium]